MDGPDVAMLTYCNLDITGCYCVREADVHESLTLFKIHLKYVKYGKDLFANGHIFAYLA